MGDGLTASRPALAVVLARGGSKGLPRKNALPVAGRPCVAWTLDAALAAHTVGLVVLSTDDTELASLGEAAGVRVAPRPPHLASDSATVDDAVRDAVERLMRDTPGLAEPRRPVVLLYGNIPVRPQGLIDCAVRLLAESGADSVQSYAPVGKHHPWWTARVDASTGAVRPWEGDVLNHGVFRRQDLPPAYVPDGGVCVVTFEALFGRVPGVLPGPHAFLGREDRRRGLITREGEVIDIDTRVDLLVADAILREAARPRCGGA